MLHCSESFPTHSPTLESSYSTICRCRAIYDNTCRASKASTNPTTAHYAELFRHNIFHFQFYLPLAGASFSLVYRFCIWQSFGCHSSSVFHSPSVCRSVLRLSICVCVWLLNVHHLNGMPVYCQNESERRIKKKVAINYAVLWHFARHFSVLSVIILYHVHLFTQHFHIYIIYKPGTDLIIVWRRLIEPHFLNAEFHLLLHNPSWR